MKENEKHEVGGEKKRRGREGGNEGMRGEGMRRWGGSEEGREGIRREEIRGLW